MKKEKRVIKSNLNTIKIISLLVILIILLIGIYIIFSGGSGTGKITGNAIAFNESFTYTFNTVTFNGSHKFDLPKRVNISRIVINWTDLRGECEGKVVLSGPQGNHSTPWTDINRTSLFIMYDLGNITDYISVRNRGACNNTRIFSLKVVGKVKPGASPNPCNHNDSCDAGENSSNCPDDCPGTPITPPISTTLYAPFFRFLPPACAYGADCSGFIIDFNNSVVIDKIELSMLYDYRTLVSRTKYENISLTSPTNPYSFSKTIGDDPKSDIIDKVQIKARVYSGNNKSGWSALADLNSITFPGCSHECLIFNQSNCTSSTSFKICGQYDTDNCLEWSSEQNCLPGDRCSSSTGRCTYTGRIDSCGDGGFCLISSVTPRNAFLYISGSCADPLETCFKCNDTYTWNNAGSYCKKNNCNVNDNACTRLGGICNLTSMNNLNWSVNSSKECCGYGDCWLCSPGNHKINNTDWRCVSSNCSGNAEIIPITGNGSIIGNRTFTIGVVKFWNYTAEEIPSECEWTCNQTTHREGSNNFCSPGAGPCPNSTSRFGCSNLSSMSNAARTLYNCSLSNIYTADEICYRCNINYEWNSSSNLCEECINTCLSSGGICTNSVIANAQVIQGTNCCGHGRNCFVCPAGYKKEGNECIKNCTGGKCLFKGRCVPDEFRGRNATGATGKYYCENGVMKNQKAKNMACTESYECRSNICGEDGECLSLQEVGGIRGIVNRMLDFLRNVWHLDI